MFMKARERPQTASYWLMVVVATFVSAYAMATAYWLVTGNWHPVIALLAALTCTMSAGFRGLARSK